MTLLSRRITSNEWRPNQPPPNQELATVIGSDIDPGYGLLLSPLVTSSRRGQIENPPENTGLNRVRSDEVVALLGCQNPDFSWKPELRISEK
jgi:hypothetical protein